MLSNQATLESSFEEKRELLTTTLSVVGKPSKFGVTVHYDTIDANSPNSYKHSVAIWEGNSPAPFNKAPLAIKQVPSDESSSSFLLPCSLGSKAYTIGYSAGEYSSEKNINAVCALANVDAPKVNETITVANTLNFDIDLLDEETLMVTYKTLNGYTPLANKNWVGIWEDENITPDKTPKFLQPVISDTTDGMVQFDVIKLTRSTYYTVGYFMGGWQHNVKSYSKDSITYLAACMTFKTK